MANGSGASRGDRNRNVRLGRLRVLGRWRMRSGDRSGRCEAGSSGGHWPWLDGESPSPKELGRDTPWRSWRSRCAGEIAVQRRIRR